MVMFEKDIGGFETVHGGQRQGVWNESGDYILDFATTYDLILTNTWFKKDSHLITFKSGTNVSQIDFILTQKVDSRCCNYCEVTPGENVTTQHRLVFVLEDGKEEILDRETQESRWWGLKREKQDMFKR